MTENVVEILLVEDNPNDAEKFMELHRLHWPEWEGECEIRLMYAENEHP